MADQTIPSIKNLRGNIGIGTANPSKKLHIDVEVVETEWGSGTPHEEFEKILSEDKNHEIKAVLAAGNDIEYEGELLEAMNFRSNYRPGQSVIISGDTAEQAIDSECDLLIHEATFLTTHTDIANEHLHSTAAGAARTAVECNAKHLALTHYSGRLENHDPSLKEAREIHSSVVALSDGDRLILNDDYSLQHLVKSPEGWNHQG